LNGLAAVVLRTVAADLSLATAHISRDTDIAMLRLMIGAHTNLP
jgi:hypothetical protein